MCACACACTSISIDTPRPVVRETDFIVLADEHCAPARPLSRLFFPLFLSSSSVFLSFQTIPTSIPRWCASPLLEREREREDTVTRGISRQANLVTKWPGREFPFHTKSIERLLGISLCIYIYILIDFDRHSNDDTSFPFPDVSSIDIVAFRRLRLRLVEYCWQIITNPLYSRHSTTFFIIVHVFTLLKIFVTRCRRADTLSKNRRVELGELFHWEDRIGRRTCHCWPKWFLTACCPWKR